MMSPGSRPNGTPSSTSRPSAVMPSPRSTRIRPMAHLWRPPSGGLDQIDSGKEVADLVRRRLRRVRSVRGVMLDRLREFLAKRSCVGLRRIGGAHQRPPLLDRIVGLEDKRNARAGRHELGKAGEERSGAMDGVKALGLLSRKMKVAHRDD